jgi:hypothetical protein
MLKVSPPAAARMANLLTAKSDQAVLRIVRRHDRLRLTTGVLRPGDETFAHEGRVVLAIDRRIARSLSLRQLEIRQTPTGPRLRLKSA